MAKLNNENQKNMTLSKKNRLVGSTPEELGAGHVSPDMTSEGDVSKVS